jgi:hypothetical protein
LEHHLLQQHHGQQQQQQHDHLLSIQQHFQGLDDI